jgi:hypothetical protein
MDNFEGVQAEEVIVVQEDVVASSELSSDDIFVPDQEVTQIEDPAVVEDKIEAIRRQLGISTKVEEDLSDKEDTETADTQKSQEGHEGEFQVNDLIVPDDDAGRIQSVLSENNISASVRSYTERVNAEDGNSWVPGEDILSILDSESGDAASFEYTKQVRELLKSNQIAARHGKMGNQTTDVAET